MLRAPWPTPSASSPLPSSRPAARPAFVRLYEGGRLVLDDRVVGTCPRCSTVVDRTDAEAGDLEAEEVVVALELEDGQPLPVQATALELLPGVVAVLVPENDPAA